MKLCLHCSKETTNPKFCSSSCSASFNNKLKPRRVKTKKCLECSELIYSDRKRCIKCRDNNSSSLLDRTLEEVIVTQNHKSSAFAKVRESARRKYYSHSKSKQCEVCGYDKHIEICHIKPISQFSLNSKLKDINDISNLAGLCPNCHWEFDHSSLGFPEFKNLHL